MAWCLTKANEDKFKKALLGRKIDPTKLATMTSQARRDLFKQFVGDANSQQVNALFESKLLLKNQQRGFITWAKRVSGISPQARRDLLSRIEKMDKVLDPKEGEQFMQDLASTRLGIGVSQQEGKAIMDFSKKISDLKATAKDGVFASETKRLEFGTAKVNLETYLNDLKLQAKRISFREKPLQATPKVIGEVPGALKSAVASLDNSFFGRQDIKNLLDVRTSKIWFKNFLKSWKDIGKELKGKDAMVGVKTDIYSRPNAINGKYRAGGYGLDVLTEEAYPSSLPEKIPLLGRLFKASESAYNGGALRMRADLADRYIAIGERHGLNMLNREEAQGMGHLVGSLTGRGSLGKAEAIGKELNVFLFSIKFLKSNFDFLTAHALDKKVTGVAKKEAAKNLLSVVSSIASVLTIAKTLDPNSVELDPRSTNFGKVKIFGRWTDITGGMASMVTLASRLTWTYHRGEGGFWYKNSAGNYTKLGTKFGGMTALDVLESYFEGKLSPTAGIARDVWRGKTFEGKPVTAKEELKNVVTPISVQSFNKLMKDPEASSVLGSMILEGLGFSVSTSQLTDWETSTSVKIKQFKKVVGEAKFKRANEQFNKDYSEWLNKTTKTQEYKQLSVDAQADVRAKGKTKIQEKVFDQYGFTYEKEAKTEQEEKEQEVIEKLTE